MPRARPLFCLTSLGIFAVVLVDDVRCRKECQNRAKAAGKLANFESAAIPVCVPWRRTRFASPRLDSGISDHSTKLTSRLALRLPLLALAVVVARRSLKSETVAAADVPVVGQNLIDYTLSSENVKQWHAFHMLLCLYIPMLICSHDLPDHSNQSTSGSFGFFFVPVP